MAYVKMGQIKATLGKALAYIARDDATQGGAFVSTNAAVLDPSDAASVAAMMDDTTSRTGRKPGPNAVLAHHVIQSFAPDEPVTAETAHRIGTDLAERITGGSHEYMIATHVDKGHVHNHIIFNATNFETGRKFRCQRDTVSRLRSVSDDLCLRAGLSVMPEPPKRTTGRSLADIYLVVKGSSHKYFLQTEIDKAAQFSRSWEELEGQLRLSGIEVARRSGSLSFRMESEKRAVRDYRLGAAFTEQAIMARLARQEVNRIDVDKSMIVDEDRDSIRVRVPGSRGQLALTLARNQVVEHGRTLRAYVPAHGEHALSTRSGRYARTVDTRNLYQWFSQPTQQHARSAGRRTTPNQLSSWSSNLGVIRSLADRVNARLRWAPTGDVRTALSEAKGTLDTLHAQYQSRLVAATDALDDPDTDPQKLESLAASLRNLERDITTVQRDVTALETIDYERIQDRSKQPIATEEAREEKLTMKDKVARRAAQIRRTEGIDASDDDARDLAEKQVHNDGDDERDRDIPGLAAVSVRPLHDTDADAGSLRERVESRAADMKARLNREGDADRLQQRRDHFATYREEAAEDLRRDQLQGDGDGDPMNMSTNRLEKRIAERADRIRADSNHDEPDERTPRRSRTR